MALNPFMPIGYQNQYSNQYQNQNQISSQTTQVQQQTGVIWVLGEEGAKSYPVAPNTMVALWDSERMVIYLKSVDAFGRPSMNILDYTMRNKELPQQQAQASQDASEPGKAFVTKDELQASLRDLEIKLKGVLKDGKSTVPDDESK